MFVALASAVLLAGLLVGLDLCVRSGALATALPDRAIMALYAVVTNLMRLLDRALPFLVAATIFGLWPLPRGLALRWPRLIRARSFVVRGEILVLVPPAMFFAAVICFFPYLFEKSLLALAAFPAAAALVLVGRAIGVRSLRRGLLRGLLAFSALVIALQFLLFEALVLRAFLLRPSGDREYVTTPSYAYNVHLARGNRDLFWTDHEAVWMAEDLRQGTLSPRKVAIGPWSERMAARAAGGVYVSIGGGVILVLDESGTELKPIRARNHALALGEDPVAGNLLYVSEEAASLHVIDARGNDRTLVELSNAAWFAGSLAVDVPHRRAFVSVLFSDGGLFEVDLDTFDVWKRMTDLHACKCVLDVTSSALWCNRPFQNEVVAVDLEHFRIRDRVEIGPVPWELTVHPASGDVFVSDRFSGQVTRIDPRSLNVTAFGHCGLKCRNLAVDPDAQVLWVASSRGVFRFPLAPPPTPPPGGLPPLPSGEVSSRDPERRQEIRTVQVHARPTEDLNRRGERGQKPGRQAVQY